MEIKKLLACAAIALGCGSVWAQTKGETFTLDGTDYTVKSDNLFTNGSFEDGVSGWKTVDYTTDAVASNFTLNAEGGFDGGAYIVTNGAGVGSPNTIRQSVAVESGKTYYFSVYTSGKAPSSNNFNYNALFKMTDNKTENGVLKAFAWPQGAEKTTTDWNKTEYVFTATTGYVGVRMGWNSSSAFDGFTLVEVEKAFNLTEWNNAKSDAEAALGEYDAKYASTERTAVENAMNVANPTNTTELDSKVKTLNDAVAAYKAKAANEQLMESKKNLTDAIARIKTEYPNTNDNLFGTDLSKWSGSTYVANNGGEHWSGVKTNYYEQTGAQWGQNSWSIAAEKTVNLPKGKYAFVVTARASQGVTSTMTVDGEEIALSNVGSVGYGVATDGEATYDMTKTYANGAGRGWEYAYAEFEITEKRDVTIKFTASTEAKQNWVSIANPVLYFNDDAKASMELAAALAELQAAIDAAPKIAVNAIGTGAFMYSKKSVDSYNSTLQTANGLLESSTATLSMVEAATKAVKELTLPALNAPSADQAYKIILTGNGPWENNGQQMDATAITSIVNGRNDAGNYNLQYLPQNANYAQAMFFIKMSEGDGYKIRFTDADHNIRYICTGVPYGGNASQIRTTTELGDALVVDVRRAGEYLQLWNTEANQYIGAQDKGVFTVYSHINFVVEETDAENKIKVNIPKKDAYITLCLPYRTRVFAEFAELYAVNEVDADGTLNLESVSEGVIEPNKAYILTGADGDYNFSGVNVAYEEPAANGLLTGVYTETLAPVGSYVLQTKNGDQAFFKVAEKMQPKLAPNKAYLTAPAATEAKLNIANATAIKAIDALVNGSAKIYDINGRQINKLQKGVNIVNGVKVMVK